MLIERVRKRLAADTKFIEPCLPSPANKPPSGSNWIHEIKHDGYRLMARRGSSVDPRCWNWGQPTAFSSWKPRAISILLRERADFALGSRFLGQAPNLPPLRRLLLQAATLFTRLTTGLQVSDTHNGLRAMTRRGAAALELRQNRMAHASECLSQIGSSGLRYVEQPVTIEYTAYSLARGRSSATPCSSCSTCLREGCTDEIIAQLILSALLAAILLYAWTEYRRSPAVAFLTVAIATSGLYFVKTRGASRDRPRGRPHSLRLGLQGTQAEP